VKLKATVCLNVINRLHCKGLVVNLILDKDVDVPNIVFPFLQDIISYTNQQNTTKSLHRVLLVAQNL
jgi:hypothetical protein